MDYYLYLRPVNEQDLELIHAWNINPVILKAFGLQDKKPNTWDDTMAWWRSLGSAMVYIVMVIDGIHSATYWKGRPIGLSWIKDIRSELPEIGGYIGDSDYYSKAVVEMYSLTLEAVLRIKGTGGSCKLNRERQTLIGELTKVGWCIDCEKEGVVYLKYERTAVQSA